MLIGQKTIKLRTSEFSTLGKYCSKPDICYMRNLLFLKNQMRVTNANRNELNIFKKMLEIHMIALYCCENRGNLQNVKASANLHSFNFCTFQMFVHLQRIDGTG